MQHRRCPIPGKFLIGYGFVVRDDRDIAIAVMAGGLQGTMIALGAEALGCRLALQWLDRNNYKRVKVESDCINLVVKL